MDNGLFKWMDGIDYEVAFWKSIFRIKDGRKWILNDSTLGKEIQLHNFDAASFLKSLDGEPLTLDVGCGMSYYTGNKVDGKEINIQYVDPLAFHYNEILDKYAQNAPRITFGMLEYLSAFYPEKNVSLVIIQNALDHSANPLKGIYESLAVLHIGGVLYLKHYPNEAEKEMYRGFHQFNIDIREGRLVLWNREETFDLNELLKGFAEIELSRYDSPDEVIAVIRKTAEVPSSLLTPQEDIAMLCSQLLVQTKESRGLFRAIKREARRRYYNFVLYAVKYINSETRERIKSWLRKLKH